MAGESWTAAWMDLHTYLLCCSNTKHALTWQMLTQSDCLQEHAVPAGLAAIPQDSRAFSGEPLLPH